MDIIDESPFFQELVDSNNCASVSGKSFSGFGRRDILFLAKLDDIVPILLIQFLVLLELDVALRVRERYHCGKDPFLDFEPLRKGLFFDVMDRVDVEPERPCWQQNVFVVFALFAWNVGVYSESLLNIFCIER